MFNCGPAIFCPITRPLYNCDLLLHFNEYATGLYVDSSVNQCAVSAVGIGTGSVTVSTAGKFGNGALITQQFPGITGGVFNSQSYVSAAGTFNPGSDEFIWSCWINQGPPGPISSEYGLMSNASPSPAGGMYLKLGSNGAGGGILLGGYLAGGTGTSGTIGTVLAQNYVTMSRKNLVAPSLDQLSLFWNGTIVANLSLPTGVAPAGTSRSNLIIGARTSDVAGLNAGYQGVIDEVYINHGPGTGIATSFTPPTYEWGAV